MTKQSPIKVRILRGSLALFAGFALLVSTTWAADEADLPKGPEKDLFIETCTACHSIDRILRANHSKAAWETTVNRMKNKGITASADEVDVILAYIQANLAVPDDK
jgi:competence protein ComEA